jgi:hypothetical protein
MQPFSVFCVIVIEGELLRPKDDEIAQGRQVENLKTQPDGRAVNERKI